MFVNSSTIARRLFCITVAGMGAWLCVAQAHAAKEVFQRTKPHVNVGTISHVRRAPQASSNAPVRRRPLVAAMPDLRIREFQFVPGNVKMVRVRIVNTGAAAAAKNRLRLTVRRIDGIPVGRMKFAVVPALAAGNDAWILVNANSILPNSAALKATTFRLDVDATKLVSESNESNNLEWHNL